MIDRLALVEGLGLARADELNPITINYSFDRDLTVLPQSELLGAWFGGEIHLTYSPVPKPSTGVLLMTGLLGLAYRQRRRG